MFAQNNLLAMKQPKVSIFDTKAQNEIKNSLEILNKKKLKNNKSFNFSDNKMNIKKGIFFYITY